MSNRDRLSFQEAARELGVSTGELEQLVASGRISSLKEGDELFFTRQAVERYSSSGEPEILLSDDDLLSGGEIDLLEGDDIDFGIDLESSDKQVGGDVPDIDLGGGDETVLNLESVLDDSESTTPIPGGDLLSGGDDLLSDGGLGDETLLDTDILDLGDDDADTFELDTTEDTLLDPTEEGTLLRGGGARVMQMKRKRSHAAWTVILALSALLLFLPLAVLLTALYKGGGATSGNANWINDWGEPLKGVVSSIADLIP